MKRRFGTAARLIITIVGAALGAAQAKAEPPREIAKRVSPSVVLLVMEDSGGQPLAMGSGFVVRDGVIATNMHVLEGAARGYAKLADQKEKHDIRGFVASDPARDLALLAVDGLHANPLVIGDSTKAAVGDEVYAVGNPRGLEGTFSAGIISSIRKIGEDSLLQITAPISPGSSGGPVVNSAGEVIGVSVATFKGGQNLNFAIPSRYLSELLPLIKAAEAFPGVNKVAKPAKSILDDLGGRSVVGVEVTDFLWFTDYLQFGRYSLSIRNKLREPVRRVVVAVIFYNDRSEVVDFQLVSNHDEIIPPGLAKRQNGQVDGSVQELTTTKGEKKPRTKLECRVLSFELVDNP